jgi:uncharacterized protein
MGSRRDVEFRSEGTRVRGHLYLPEGAGPHPALAMAGGWCYVKELVLPEYARAFAEAGIAVLAFDYRNFGESDGEPRQHVDPWAQIEDYKNALSHLETLGEIDPHRLGVWGISYSGGHVLIVAATDPRVKCVISNIPVVDGQLTMKQVHGALAYRRLAATILEDRRKRAVSGAHGYLPMSSADPANELSTWPFPEVKEAFAALQRTVAPNHQHRNTIASIELLESYDVTPFLPRILLPPVLLTVAERDDITLWQEEIRVFGEIATPNKQLFICRDTTHMTLYSNLTRLELLAREGCAWAVRHLLGAD